MPTRVNRVRGRVVLPMLSESDISSGLPFKLKRGSSNGNSLCGGNSAGSREMCATFQGDNCGDISEIAVGTLITERPPHRTERAPFGHSAPTSGI
jgi:hypothetical protein